MTAMVIVGGGAFLGVATLLYVAIATSIESGRRAVRVAAKGTAR